MVKRLFVSLTLLSLAVFSLGAAAVAYMTHSPGSADVTIATGSPQLQVTVDVDCDDADVIGPTDSFAGELSWTGVMPGDTTEDCITVHNTGDGDLNVHLDFGTFTGNSALLDTIEFRVISDAAGDTDWLNANDSVFTEDRGQFVGGLGEGDELQLEVRARFPSTGEDQTALSDTSFGFRATLTGYTD